MSLCKFYLTLFLFSSFALLCGGCVAANAIPEDSTDLPLLEKWSGEYPVAELAELPAGQEGLAGGYIADAETFSAVWQAFMPGKKTPVIDFSRNILVFARNTLYYNRISILKVTLQNGTAEIIAMETMSAIPIEKKVAMAMAIIPRKGVTAIRTGTDILEVRPYK